MKKSEEELDSDLMDELLDAMSGRDADALHKPQAAAPGHTIEIHIKPGVAPMIEKEDDEDEDEMLPAPNMDAMKKGKR